MKITYRSYSISSHASANRMWRWSWLLQVTVITHVLNINWSHADVLTFEGSDTLVSKNGRIVITGLGLGLGITSPGQNTPWLGPYLLRWTVLLFYLTLECNLSDSVTLISTLLLTYLVLFVLCILRINGDKRLTLTRTCLGDHKYCLKYQWDMLSFFDKIIETINKNIINNCRLYWLLRVPLLSVQCQSVRKHDFCNKSFIDLVEASGVSWYYYYALIVRTVKLSN